VHASATLPDPLDAAVSGRPVRTRSACCQQDGSHALKRPMTAASGDFGQRSYGTRRNLLLSHPVPGQPQRPHASCTGKGCLTESITAAPVDEPRIARGLGVTCVPARDGSRQRRLPRRRAGVRHKSSLSAHPATTMSESSNERISGHRSATVSSASSACGDREYSRVPQGVVTPPKKKPGVSHPPLPRISNGGGPPDAARLLPRPVPRRDLSEYLC
jgi:hypothetical protein